MDEIDVTEMAHEVAVLAAAEPRKRIAVVVPLAPGMREVVQEYLAEGPPFDPAALGISHHEVFLTDDEALFVFEGEHGLQGLESMLAERDFWDVLPAWEHAAAGRPRLAELAFVWHAEA